MGAGHEHTASLGDRHRGRLWAALALMATVMVVEIIGGIATGSLALLSDAAHMGTDALGISMALAAITAVRRGRAHPARTFGLYRLEVLAALANTLLLFGVAGWVIYESIGRFGEPPEVSALAMLLVACTGFAASLTSLLMLRTGASESINVRGAYLEVLGDLVGSIGVVIAAVVILVSDWYYADPIVAIAVGLFILPRAAKLGRDALRILLQTAPRDVDVPAVGRSLADVDGVAGVHDLHVWTLTSGMDVASAHLTIEPGVDLGRVLECARATLNDRFHISHATLQVEPAGAATGCEALSW